MNKTQEKIRKKTINKIITKKSKGLDFAIKLMAQYDLIYKKKQRQGKSEKGLHTKCIYSALNFFNRYGNKTFYKYKRIYDNYLKSKENGI